MNLPVNIGILSLITLAFAAYRWTRRLGPDDTNRRVRSDLVAGGILFAFFAPAIGGIAVTLAISVIALEPKNLMMMVFGLPWFYIFGGVPALLCGIVAGALRPDRPTWRSYVKVAIVGSLFGIGFLLSFSGANREWRDALFPLIVGGVPGMISAFLCSVWFYGKPGSQRAVAPVVAEE